MKKYEAIDSFDKTSLAGDSSEFVSGPTIVDPTKNQNQKLFQHHHSKYVKHVLFCSKISVKHVPDTMLLRSGSILFLKSAKARPLMKLGS